MKGKSVKNFRLLTNVNIEKKSEHTFLKNFFRKDSTKSKQRWFNSSKIDSINERSMNKINGIEYIVGTTNNENKDLISQIEHSIIQMEIARNIFNNVNESELIEIAIYSEEAAKKKLDYLISLAKEKSISINSEYITCKFLEFTK